MSVQSIPRHFANNTNLDKLDFAKERCVAMPPYLYHSHETICLHYAVLLETM